jgi:phosphopantothenoylcysteine decarboxylase/phosphopantothenate--cysteine ligase
MKTVVLGVTSGIAAYKTVDLVKLLKAEGVAVHVIMTKKATNIVSPAEFEQITGNKVSLELFEKDFDYKKILNTRKVDHIALADNADVFVIAPATANTVAKIANGFADDFLTTTLLAVTAPVIICPSMNVHMWSNPIVKENIKKLKSLGYQIIRPKSGMLACGYEGEGKLEDVVKIKDEIMKQLTRTTSLKGQKVIVTAGGTREKIDEVRFITNRSSGKMGIALAEELYLRGAEVLLIHAKDSVRPRYLMQEEVFETSIQLHDLIKTYAKSYDTIFHAAAVSDFQVAAPQEGKISSSEEFSLTMKPQIKIIDQIKNWNPTIKLIAFKATAGQDEKAMIETAGKKLKDANADGVIANDIAAFDNDMNEAAIVLADGSMKKIHRVLKNELARLIMDFLSDIAFFKMK